MAGRVIGFADFDLKPRSGKTLTRQLHDQLRRTILAGSLPPGYRLPSSRELARQLKISRNTVAMVIDQLAMEGYLEVTQGRRPTVAQTLKPGMVIDRTTSRRRPAALRISNW